MLAIAAVLSVLMGVALGLLGGGGSIMTVPILVYLLSMPTKAAVATSLLVVGSTSVFGLVLHARAGNVQWRTGAIFAAFAMLGAFLGGLVARYIPGGVLLGLFTALMLVTGVMMLRGKKVKAEHAGGHAVKISVPKVAAEGLVVGSVTGLVGAGGGFLVVPALVLLAGLSMQHAIGTSLFVIALKSFAGFAGYAAHVTIDYPVAGLIIGAALVGTFIGVKLAQRIEAARLRKGFAWFVLVMGAFMIYKQAGPYMASAGLPNVALLAMLAAVLGAIAMMQRRLTGISA
ncbi:MAG: sulfite exporter TauE/SafE family protein [Myxococcales bacterium]|nr:sulfite exporter TauE/SafE family protein [Myxococcales bacterium]MCB9525913.1 sulfite exporter TauE/SafE family protein [Myxococcales bacterium]